jgi:hypothetical protein
MVGIWSTFVSKQCAQHQCSNNTNRWMTSMSIPYEPMKSKICMTIITTSCPMKFVMDTSHPSKSLDYSMI